ncbi:hypothetical protein [Streptomyces sp. NPDC059003]|uniref:hypothetical protein n=1 Tax=Streptomyces sp. NPDC059003 TaxID=3346691 RepID=UPI00367A8CE8
MSSAIFDALKAEGTDEFGVGVLHYLAEDLGSEGLFQTSDQASFAVAVDDVCKIMPSVSLWQAAEVVRTQLPELEGRL